MAKATRLPSGTWRCQVYERTDENGKKIYKSFIHKKREVCEEMATKYQRKMQAIREGTAFELALDEYIKSRTDVLSPSTIRGYRVIEKYLKREHGDFCALKAEEIDKYAMQDLVNDMVASGSSPKSIRNRIGLINCVLKHMDLHVPYVQLPERQKPDLHIPDTKDVRRIIKESEGTEMEIPILLAAFAPMRRSEIIALHLEDIHGDTIHVKRAVVMDEKGQHIVKGTKTYESNRNIPMDHDIIEKIRKKGCVTKITNPEYMTRAFECIADKAGCPGVRFHDLRHWCASYLHARGVPDQYIMARGGWKTDKVMKDVYRHELESECGKWADAILDNFKDVL